MPLSEGTERALEACYDAILAPTLWSSALQSLAESFEAASCTFYEHDRENSPGPVPISIEHEAYSVRWARNRPMLQTRMSGRTFKKLRRS